MDQAAAAAEAASLGAAPSVDRRAMFEKQAPFLLQARLLELWRQTQQRMAEGQSDFDLELAWVTRYRADFRKLFDEERDFVMSAFDEGRMPEEKMLELQQRLDGMSGQGAELAS